MSNGDIHKLGTLYMNGSRQPIPTRPWRNDMDPGGTGSSGNIPSYPGGNIEIRDTYSSDSYKVRWVEVNVGDTKLLICDRNLAVDIDWNTLNYQSLIFGKTIIIDGQKYKIRSLTGGTDKRDISDLCAGGRLPNEWDNIIVNEGSYSGLPRPNYEDLNSNLNSSDKNSSHNYKWNWYGCYSWCQDTYSHNTAYRAYRGYNSARIYGYNYASNRHSYVGWRPVLEVLNTAPLISDSNRNLGNHSSPLIKSYTVTEPDNDKFSIVEKLDDSIIRQLSGQNHESSFTIDLSSRWGSLSNSTHTLQVVATDVSGASTTRTWTFTKTNTPPNAPEISSPSQGLRVDQDFYVEFVPRIDNDGDTQNLKLEIASDSSFSVDKQIFTSGLQMYNSNTQLWENTNSCTSIDVGKRFRLRATGLINDKTKYIRIGTTDSNGSNTTVYSSYTYVNIGNILEFKTLSYVTDYLPTRIIIKDKSVIDNRASITVKACNNGNDTNPTWEDVTNEYLVGDNYKFKNKSKTADKYAVKLHFKIVSNNSTGVIEFQAIGMGVS